MAVEQIGTFMGWGMGLWGEQSLYGCDECGAAVFNPDIHQHEAEEKH